MMRVALENRFKTVFDKTSLKQLTWKIDHVSCRQSADWVCWAGERVTVFIGSWYALYIPTIGKRRPGQPRTSYLTYVQRLLKIMKEQCKNSRLPHLLMIVVHGETLWSPAPQPLDDDDDDDDAKLLFDLTNVQAHANEWFEECCPYK